MRAWGGDVVSPGGTGDVVALLNEQQTVRPQRFFGTVTGGTFTLTFSGQTTDSIPYNATPGEIQTALEGLSNVNVGDVAITSPNPGGGSSLGGPYTVEFTGAFAGTNVPAMTGNGTGLTGTGTFAGSVAIATVVEGGTLAVRGEVCSVATQCKSGAVGTDAGVFNSANNGTGIAVSPATGDVFVADIGGAINTDGNRRIQQFEADGDFVRAWGFGVDTGASQFEVCTASSSCQAGLFASQSGPAGHFGGSSPAHLAVDAANVVYASDSAESDRIVRFDVDLAPGSGNATMTLLPAIANGTPLMPGTTNALKVIPANNHLLVARGTGAVQELDTSFQPPALVEPEPHIKDSGLTPNGIDINSATGDLYVSSNSTVPGSGAQHRIYVADDDGASGALDVTLDPPTGVTAHEAAFAGSVNPAGFPVSYHFEVSSNGAIWTPVAPDVSLGSGITPVDIPVNPSEGQAVGLEACTAYRVRVLATRGFGNGAVPSSELSFATDCVAPDVATFNVLSVSDTVAQLRGTVNPNKLPTTYWFEYGGPVYGNQVPVAAGSAGSGGMVQAISQELSGLAPSATYHYRLCATNAQGTRCGVDRTFTTLAPKHVATSIRSFELVSPADKIAGVGVCSYSNSNLRGCGNHKIAVDGNRVAVNAGLGSTLLDGGFSYANDWAFAERSAMGWNSHSPFTHPNYSPSARRFAGITTSADDLSLLGWTSNGSHIGVFPEIEAYPQPWSVGHLSDWDGRWEVAGPTSAEQMSPGASNAGVSVNAVSGDGTHAVLEGSPGYLGGLSGFGDPYFDRTAGNATYIEDVSAGLSDSFPDTSVRTPVGVCSAGTELPSVDSGDLSGRPCPGPVEYPSPGSGQFRDGSLVSPLGTSFGGATVVKNAISQDGSRVFFTDQQSLQLADDIPPCTGNGPTTSCPPQLYVRQKNSDGSVVVRWISRPTVAGQDASLLASAVYEGASINGDKVFFKTQTPLTPDDPDGAPPAGGVTTGTPGGPGNGSWDLYMYELTPGNDPTGAGAKLTRISGGPFGNSDCNVAPADALTTTSLRFASDDGERLYFTCAAPLGGVGAATNGTDTVQSGTPSTTGTRNLYLYDATKPLDERWRFIAQLTVPSSNHVSRCASVNSRAGGPINNDEDALATGPTATSCVRGASAGDFITFMTRDRLVPGDPGATSADVYAYVFDAATDRLTRISAAQGGLGGDYPCVTGAGYADTGQPCHAEYGGAGAADFPSLVTDPADPADRVAFFQSKVRLTVDDPDDQFDVYQWRNGDLTLLTPATPRPAYYAGVSADGRDIFIEAMDRLSWQDTDAVMDLYDLRLGGGIPQPPTPPTPCSVLLGGCQDGGAGAVSARPGTTSPAGGGNVEARDRMKIAVARLGTKARRRAARTGVLVLSVRTSAPGRLTAVARARIGKRVRKIGRASTQARRAGKTKLTLRLNGLARRQLGREKSLKVTLRLTSPGAQMRTMTVRLSGARS